MVTNVILILYNSSINNKLISRDLLPVFAPFLRQKMIANSHNIFKSDSFLNESMSRLNDSVQS